MQRKERRRKYAASIQRHPRACLTMVIAALLGGARCHSLCSPWLPYPPPVTMRSRDATALTVLSVLGVCHSFQVSPIVPCRSRHAPCPLLLRPRCAHTVCKSAGKDEEGDGVDYSADPITAFLGKFLPKGEKSNPPQAKDLVFNVGEDAKRKGMAAGEMASALDEALRSNGWFVTGRVDASLFSEGFFFSDPQVSLTGVDKYAEGVAKLFNQEESRCDVISTEVDGEDIVVNWRLSGRINLPFNPPIKPYVVTTTFERDSDGLLSTQRDEFSIAGWDILLHAVFPGHPFGADPAPPVPPVAS